MNKFYLTSSEINELITRGESVATADFIKAAKKFCKSRGFELTTNLQACREQAWTSIKSEMEALPNSNSFKNYYLNGLKTWHLRLIDPSITLAYINQSIFKEGYNLLWSPKWKALSDFRFDFSLLGLNSDNPLQIWLDSNCDYRTYFESYAKKHCDPASLLKAEKLQTILNELFKDKDQNERFKIVSAVQEYAAQTDGMPFEKLVKLINK